MEEEGSEDAALSSRSWERGWVPGTARCRSHHLLLHPPSQAAPSKAPFSCLLQGARCIAAGLAGFSHAGTEK